MRASRKHDDAPAFQWYPKDIKADANYRSCGHAARGLWRDLLDDMYMMPERGSVPGNLEVIARLAGLGLVETATLLQELETHRVYSWAKGLDILEGRPPFPWIINGEVVIEPWPGHVICNRKMYGKYRLSVVRAECGKLGGAGRHSVSVQANGKQTGKQNLSKTLANVEQTPKQNGSHKPNEINSIGELIPSKLKPKRGGSDSGIGIGRSVSGSGKPPAGGIKAKCADLRSRSLESIRTASTEDLIGMLTCLERGKNPEKIWRHRITEMAKHTGGLDVVTDELSNFWHSLHPERGGHVGPFKNFPAHLNKVTSKWLQSRR